MRRGWWSDVVDFQPAWMSFEVNEALSRLPTRKMRTTVLRLAEARTVGRSAAETFKLPDVCSRRTWYGRYREGEHRPGWKDDPQVQSALAVATARAQWWEDNKIVRSIERARERLAEASPAATFSPPQGREPRHYRRGSRSSR